MRVGLISDTHGQLGIIDRLARVVRADAVLHAGDFGFYDGASADRLSDRELRLSLLHSSIDGDEKRRVRELARAELQALVKDSGSLGELPDSLEGARAFSVPVQAVWGNHEDRSVVEQLLDGKLQVGNLHLVPPGAPRSLASTEFAGRRAGRGKSPVAHGRTGASTPARSKIARANSYQEQTPAPVTCRNPCP